MPTFKPLSASLLSFALLSALLAAPHAVAQAEIAGIATAVDGDTLDMDGLRIRLFGVDAPEGTQTCKRPGGASWPCGGDARAALAARLGGTRITCTQKDIDSYRRVVAVCRKGGEDLNAWLVSRGWAVAYREFSSDYVDEEAAAQRAKLGIWNGSFQMPSDFRRAQDAADRAAPPARPGCRIKGNIGADGTRIYHVPGGEFYERTVISPGKGERMFCSEQEARAAGWRRAR